MSSAPFTIVDLQRAAGVATRTLRRWTKSKALPKAIGRGRGARYEEDHLLRARVIRKLLSEDLSLKQIRARTAALSRTELMACLPQEAPAPVSPVSPVSPVTPVTHVTAAAPTPSPVGYPSTSWEVVQLVDGLVLLVNPARSSAQRLAAQLYQQCRATQAAGAFGG